MYFGLGDGAAHLNYSSVVDSALMVIKSMLCYCVIYPEFTILVMYIIVASEDRCRILFEDLYLY